jgi:adenosylmethionine-8-amino-7-oxononanoate aminotransferase
LVHAFASPAVIESDGPITLVRGKGVYVWDSEGRKYLDGVA